MARRARISAAVLRLLRGAERHAWTLDELQAGLAQRGQSADFSSIFRAVERLAAVGAVIKLVLADGRTRIELGGAHHDHLHCVRCNRVVPIPCVFGHGEIVALEREAGIAITEHHLVLNGFCQNCRAYLVAEAAR